MNIYHINDVIAHGDTTTQRLRLQYSLLSEQFGISEYTLHLIPAPFGDSKTTAWIIYKLIITSIEKRDDETTLCVNNASRAKHVNSKNSKGSQCLWATYTYNGKKMHFSGVDNEVFLHLNTWFPFKKLRIIQNISLNNITRYDISQGSQFRSLEFFPLVQYLILTKRYASLDSSEISIEELGNISKDTPIQKSYQAPTLIHKSKDPLINLQSIQLIGQFKKYCSDRNIPEEFLSTPLPDYDQKNYEIIKQSLQPNEVIIIDRDHYNNTKCLSSHQDGIIGLSKACGFSINQEIILSRNGGKDIGWAVSSISCKTGFPCLRNGSSRGPQGEKLIEMNYSIDASGKTWQKIATLPLGTRIFCSIKNNSDI